MAGMVVRAMGQVNGANLSNSSVRLRSFPDGKSGRNSGRMESRRHVELGPRRVEVVANLLNWRGDDRRSVLRMMKFQMHAPPDVLHFEHRASPGRAGDRDLHGLGTS